MGRQTVLIVDDDATFRAALAEELAQAGFEVMQAEGGARGLEVATAALPSLVLCDMRMPDLDGLQFLVEIKQRKLPTRVVMVTGTATNLQHTVKFIKEGACDVIHKGFDGEEAPMESIVNAVRRVLALEVTLDAYVSNPSPVLKELLCRAGRLEDENEDLRRKLDEQTRRHHRAEVIARASYLGLAVVITFLFKTYNVVSDNKLFWLPVVLYVIVNLPFARVRKIVALGKGEAVFGE